MNPSRVEDLDPQLRRRDFLAYGAAAALLPSISRAGAAEGDGLALGYCRDPSGVEAATRVVAADRLAAGDPELARRGVRVTVEGLVGDAERLARMGIRGLDLTVRYELAEAGCGAVDFRAWSCQRLPVGQQGSPNSFTVPVDGGLRIGLEVETPLGVERREAVLVAGGEPGRPKLRAGRYLIAPGGVLPRRFEADASEPLIAWTVEAV